METKTQEYLRKKKIKELGLPMMYIVKSTREGVELIQEAQVVEIKENSFRQISTDGVFIGDSYLIETFPYEAKIRFGEKAYTHTGYGSGFGDLWQWSYFCCLDKTVAEEYFITETNRITEKYLSGNPPDEIIMPCG